MDKEIKIADSLTGKTSVYSYCREKISEISQKLSVINAQRAEALRYYQASPSVVPYKEGRSRAVTTDLSDTVEWAMPALLEIFCGQDKSIAIEPAEGTDVKAAELLDMLISYQLQVRNNWYLICHDWFKDAMLGKMGIVKYSWYREEKRIKKLYEELSEEEYKVLASRPDINIVSVKQRYANAEEIEEGVESAASLYDVEAEFIKDDEYPKIQVIPPEDFGCDPNVTSIDDAPFIFHRIYLQPWMAKKIYGDFVRAKWDELPRGQMIGESDMMAIQQKEVRNQVLGATTYTYDEYKDLLIIYECYYYNADGEPRMAILCGNDVLWEGENIYGRPPFVAITPVKLSHKILGLSVADLVQETQRLRTILLRQIIDNLYQSNYRRYFVDPERVNMADFLDLNTTNAAIRTKGDPKLAAMPELKAPLPPEVFQFWEMLQIERDYHSGIPRSYQGVLPSVAHRTARGQNQQIQLASQRIQAIARLIAEMGMKPLINHVIDMNIKFLKKKTSIRYLNEWIEIDPDNIIGKYDVKVSVGLGVPDKETIIVQAQQLLGIYAQLVRSGVSVVNAQNVYNLLAKMLNAMNIKNVQDYITDPGVISGLSQIYLMLIQLITQQGGDPATVQAALQQISQVFAAAGVPVTEIQQKITQAMTAEQIGAEAPEQPMPPEQPIAPRTTPEGRGFYA